MNKNISVITNYIKEIRSEYPNITNDMLYNNGEIYYMNGNDGTNFDWGMNDRICEFYVFGKNTYGFIKLFVNKNDTMKVYVYNDFGPFPTKEYSKTVEQGFSLRMKKLMCTVADNKDLYDQPLNVLFK